MEKLVIRSRGVVQREFTLEQKDVTIGRDSRCTVRLNDPSVSRDHARLVRLFTDYYVEDMGSTNGTLLNARAVTKHILRHGDRLTLGGFELQYLDTTKSDEQADDLDRTIVLQPRQRTDTADKSPVAAKRQSHTSRSRPRPGRVRYLLGPHRGETMPLTKSLFTIGRPGEKMAVITRRPRGYYLLHLGGDAYPIVNSKPLQRGGRELHHGDIIEVGDNRLELLLEEISGS